MKKKVLLVLIGGGLSLIPIYAIELMLFNEPYNNGSRVTWGCPVNNNSQGWRDIEWRAKWTGVTRILVVGDSFTWGVGLDTKSRYSGVLQQLLDTTEMEYHLHGSCGRLLGVDYEVLTIARPGLSTVDEAALVAEWGPKLEVDRIVVGFCVNDPKRGPEAGCPERDRLDASWWGRSSAWTGKAMRTVGLPMLGEKVAAFPYIVSKRLGWIPDMMSVLDKSYDTDSEDWRQFRAALREIRKYSRQRPIFISLNQGIYAIGRTDYLRPDERLSHYLRWYHQAEQEADAAGFLAINCESELATYQGPWVINAIDGHATKGMNEIYAKRIEAAMQ